MVSDSEETGSDWSYDKAISYLFNLERIGIKFGLDNTLTLLNILGNPQKKLTCVHVAGTNGKGSTSHFLSSLLVEAGYRVGLYTSPHLISFNERIKINGLLISDQKLADLIGEVKTAIDLALESGRLSCHPTYFEVSTVLALLYFSRIHLDMAILECGMGGRLDATNVVKPVLSVITSIGLEHQQYLGTTLPDIATEKAGIIKPGVPVVLGAQDPEIRKLLVTACQEKNSPVFLSTDSVKMTPGDSKQTFQEFDLTVKGRFFSRLTTRLLGNYQPQNAALAVAALEQLAENGFKYNRNQLVRGIKKAFCPGRGHFLSNHQPPLLIDGAHNPAAINKFMELLEERFSRYELTFIIGIMEDKDIKAMLKLVAPKASQIILTRSASPRAVTPEYLFHLLPPDDKIKATLAPGVKEAIYSLDFLSRKQQLVCITGSLYVVGEAYDYLKIRPY